MSRIYALIEEQVNNILRMILEDDETGQIKWNGIISGPTRIRPFITFVSFFVFLALILTVGVFFWNKGLQPVFPGIVAKIDSNNPAQAPSEYVQLVTTLFAIMMFM
jgi:hypothetical protein